MRDVVIAGIGQTPVGEQWELSLRNSSALAIQAARKDAGGLRPESMYVGNLLASVASHQANLGALLTDNTNLEGIEAYSVEAGEASAAAAFRMAYLAVASGWVDIAMAVGVEKYTDRAGQDQDDPIYQILDYDYEYVQGLTPLSQAGLLFQRYLHENPSAQREAFGTFSLIAHENAVHNPNAMFRKALRPEMYMKAAMVSDPLNMFDVAPYADGAAAILLTTPEMTKDLPHPLVRVIGSDIAIDTLAVHDRPDPLAFRAAGISLEQACHQAGILPSDVDFFELHDAFSIYAVLSAGSGWLCPAR